MAKGVLRMSDAEQNEEIHNSDSGSSQKDSLSQKVAEHSSLLRELAQYTEARAQEAGWWFTAGLVGLTVLVSGSLGAEVMTAAPLLLTRLTLTFTLASGITLILSRTSMLSSKKSAERTAELVVKAHESWRHFKAEASIPELPLADPELPLADQLKLVEELLSRMPELSRRTDGMLVESGRQATRSIKRVQRGGYLFNISLVLAVFSVVSFLVGVWWPVVF
jgi:hypothetical protein